MKKNILEFIDYYFDELNTYIRQTAEKLASKDTNYSEELIYVEKIKLIEEHMLQIYSALKRYEITEKELKEYIYHDDVIKYVGDLYEKYGIKKSEKTTKEILRTFLLNEIKIDKNFIKSVSKIQNFLDSNNINELYKLKDLSFNLEKKDNSDFSSVFINVFNNILRYFDKSKQIQFFSQITVFVEEYSTTDLGHKYLELIRNNYQEELKQSVSVKNKEFATLNWIKNLLNAYNNCTARVNNILINDSTIILEKLSIHPFNNLFFINNTKIPNKLKKSFDLINNIKSLKKFKTNLGHITEYKTISISNKDFRAKSGEVVKYSLFSTIINKILNLYYIETKDKEFIELFNKNNKNSTLNSNLTKAVNIAIKYVLKDLRIVKYKSNTDKKFLSWIQLDINRNPLSYIDYLNKKYYKSTTINTNFEDKYVDLKEKDFEDFENLEYKLQEYMLLKQEKNLFLNKSILFFNREELSYNNEVIKIDTTNVDKKFKKLTTIDLMILLEFNEIVKSSYYGKDSFNQKTTEKVTDQFIEIRGIGCNFNYNNKIIKETKIEDIDKMMVDTFILGKYAKENLEAIKNNQDMDNLVRSLIFYTNNKNDNIKIEIYEKIIYFSDDITKLRIALNKENNFRSIKQYLNYIKSIQSIREETIKIREKTNQEKSAIIKAEEKTIKIKEETILSIIEIHIKFKATKKQFENMLNSKLEILKELKENNITNIIEFVKNSKNESFIKSLNNFLLKNHLKHD